MEHGDPHYAGLVRYYAHAPLKGPGTIVGEKLVRW